MKISPQGSQFTRRQLLQGGLPLVAASGLLPGLRAAKKSRKPELNVLFIAVDDLRPALGCYGDSRARTPHIDALAARGLTFHRAYCQQATCGSSRASVMTGRRPDSTGVFDQNTHFRRRMADAATLPERFKKAGYATTAFGKIFPKPQLDDLPSWSIAPWVPGRPAWGNPGNKAFSERQWTELRGQNWVAGDGFDDDSRERNDRGDSDRRRSSWEASEMADEALPDGQIADAALGALRELGSRRFFLAVGFLKPHLPFVAPKKYYDLYPAGEIELPPNTEPPLDAPPYALHDSPELRGYADIPPAGPVPEHKARELIRGYLAGVSFVDAQIGRLLRGLEDSGLSDRTVIVLWGDHGYHLGEHGLWNKNTDYEAAARAPLIASLPGQQSKGRKTAALTELVDIYPSLCEICGIPKPLGLEGSSFAPLFEDPDRLWKRAVFSQCPREIPGVGAGMGYSMRTHRYRYTEWTVEGSPHRSAELYDYEADPLELMNIANRPENISLVNGLSGMLHEGWRSSLPPSGVLEQGETKKKS